MNFDSDIEHSEVESFGSSAQMCETELEKDHEELYSSDPEGPYIYGWAYYRRWMVSRIQPRSWTEWKEKPGVAKSLWQEYWHREMVSVCYFSPAKRFQYRYRVEWKDERCIRLLILPRSLGLFHRCSCGHCAPDRLQNPQESRCRKEIEKCVESLGSTAVLNEVEISPECIFHCIKVSGSFV